MNKAPLLLALLLNLGFAAQAQTIIGSCELGAPLKYDSGAIISTQSHRTNDGRNYDYSYRYKNVALIDKSWGHIGNLHDTAIRGEYNDNYGQPSLSLFPPRYFFGSNQEGLKVIIQKAGRGGVKNNRKCVDGHVHVNTVTKIPVKITREEGGKSETAQGYLKCFTYYQELNRSCDSISAHKSEEKMWSPKKVDAVYTTIK